MRYLKKILLVILSLVVLIIVGGLIYFNSLKPDYSGEIKLQNIEKNTDVYFDEYGIPHIYAENQLDAITVLGYVHAQERLWQMELMRRIAPGRLSELFGENALENDKFFVSLGIDESSKKTIGKLDENSIAYKQAMAYLNGVNQFIETGTTPLEFTVFGIEKEKYQLKDIYNVLGYMSFSFAMAHKTDPLLSVIEKKLGVDYLKELNIDVDPNTTLIKSNKNDIEKYEDLISFTHDVTNSMPVPAFIGSNSWVVSAKKTSTGKVLFANDPHIGYSQPAIWYEAHISTPDYEMYGYYLAGVPFPLLGHNRNFAYGVTMFENDDLNFYAEENHPSEEGKYKTPDGYLDYTTEQKTIKVRSSDDVSFEVRSSRHGPILNDVLEQITESKPIAMWWTYTQAEGNVLEALYKISHASKMEDAKEGASLIHAPGLNIMYGDAQGNIAWWAAGKLIKYKPHVNTKFILDGASGEDDPIAFLDFSNNPMAENPSWEYVYSANNQPDTTANTLYPGYYLPEDRANRIVQLLEKKNNWEMSSFSEMINDVTSPIQSDLKNEFLLNLNYNTLSENEQKAFNILKDWDGTNSINEIAPTIYNKLIYTYLKNTFRDELDEETFTHLLNTHFMKRGIADHMKRGNSIWWDDILTEDKIESKKDILSKSFIESIKSIELQLGEDISNWEWGKVHTIEHRHPMGEVSVLRKLFNIGPSPINGAREVINNRGYNYDETGLYNVYAGPSTRRIIDFSDVENSLSILPTGQSGIISSEHYEDQNEMYNKGEFRKMKLNKDEIINSSTKLTFFPNK
ncbi:MAG: penicillin acylase family protein [Bacteroidetes bacterium]|nr:penicillin acylase family protein [Bacteroidota bacterium]